MGDATKVYLGLLAVGLSIPLFLYIYIFHLGSFTASGRWMLGAFLISFLLAFYIYLVRMPRSIKAGSPESTAVLKYLKPWKCMWAWHLRNFLLTLSLVWWLLVTPFGATLHYFAPKQVSVIEYKGILKRCFWGKKSFNKSTCLIIKTPEEYASFRFGPHVVGAEYDMDKLDTHVPASLETEISWFGARVPPFQEVKGRTGQGQ